jgi:hypothetical protein
LWHPGTNCDEPLQYAKGKEVVGAHDGGGPRLKRKKFFHSLFTVLDAKSAGSYLAELLFA